MGEPMRALSVREPVSYLAGVLAGDGYLSRSVADPVGDFGLHVADEDFACAFADALNAAYDISVRPNWESAGYWRVRSRNRGGCFNYLRTFPADANDDQRRAWLRGFFDSDGNASLVPKPERGLRSCSRRVSFYKTDLAILGAAVRHLEALGFPLRVLRKVALTESHYGTLQVYELALRSSRDTYVAFARQVGSSLHRKQATLDAIGTSYCDRLAASREAGAKGAATKRARAEAERLPALLAAVADHVASGGSTTYRGLAHLDGYWSARKTLGLAHGQIVEMASGKKEDAA